MSTLQDLYIDQLQDLYDAEQQITDALPKMARHATSSRLREGFEEHLEQTKEQIQRLDQIFKGAAGHCTSDGASPEG
jgi:ferritin-like metal-binding protein YciE